MAWIFEPRDVRDALNAFTRELAGPKAKSLGWTFAPDEDHIRRQFKSVFPHNNKNIDDSVCLESQDWLMNLSISHPKALRLTTRIVKVAMEMFGKWVKGDKSAIHPDL